MELKSGMKSSESITGSLKNVCAARSKQVDIDPEIDLSGETAISRRKKSFHG